MMIPDTHTASAPSQRYPKPPRSGPAEEAIARLNALCDRLEGVSADSEPPPTPYPIAAVSPRRDH